MKNKILNVIFWGFFSIFFLLHAVINGAVDWYNIRFGVTFEEILFTITSPLAGADASFLDEAVLFTMPYVKRAALILIVIFIAAFVIHQFKNKIANIVYKLICVVGMLAVLINAISFAVESLSLDEYIARKMQETTIYEDYYVDPNSVSITCEGEPKNLIYIYLESMETTYASKEVGGFQDDVNYIPKLTQLANENISFSDTEKLGGAHVSYGTTWTMGALYGTTTGTPFSFPVEGNSMSERQSFADGVTSLGDLLNSYGYTQKFLCGSDAVFAGRKLYFEQHGNYEMQDYWYAIVQSYIPLDYYVWWGYEDDKLYDVARVELLKLAESDEPFNFTMLTVDTHHVDGYVCQNCQNTYDNQLGNVLECADNQIYEFIQWCQEQDFYEDTVIVISGDHLRMDSSLVAEAGEADARRLYNCILNSDATTELGEKNRIFTSLDLFPTTLGAMGYTIEGDRLGLGTNLFSDTPTLSEELGYDYFNTEISKYSEFYVETFD